MADIEQVIAIGDRLRFSVALLRAIDAMPEHRTVVVTVMAIDADDEGVKIVHLTRDAETRNTVS